MSLSKPLTPRQLFILSLVAEGLTDKQVAARTGLATVTAKVYLSIIKKRLGLAGTNRVGLARWYWLNHEQTELPQLKAIGERAVAWWLREGKRPFTGAPEWLFALRTALDKDHRHVS